MEKIQKPLQLAITVDTSVSTCEEGYFSREKGVLEEKNMNYILVKKTLCKEVDVSSQRRKEISTYWQNLILNVSSLSNKTSSYFRVFRVF